MNIDVEMQRRQAIHSFVTSEGFKIFMEELNGLCGTNQSDLDKLLKDKINDERLAQLNFVLGQKKGYDRIKLVLDTFVEELENSPVAA